MFSDAIVRYRLIMRKNVQTIILVGLSLALMVFGLETKAADECELHNRLTRFVLYIDHFLDHLSDGHHPDSPEILDRFLALTPIASLRQDMSRAGLQRFEQMTVNISAEQRTLLDFYKTAGRNVAYEQSLQFGSYQKLVAYQNLLATASCTDQRSVNTTEEDHEHNSGFAYSATVSLITLPGMAIFAMLYLKETRSRFKKRRGKRFPCNLDCTYTRSGQSHPATIIDISCFGAKLKTHTQCTPGDTANIKIANVNFNVLVRWTGADSTGVQFTKAFPNDILQNLLKHTQNQTGREQS